MKNHKCMNCRSQKLERFIDFGHQPSGNFFPKLDEINEEQTFPFAMLVCTECWQVQIEEFPSVKHTFSNHPYITGINQPVVLHFQRLANDIIEKYSIPKNSLVLDIGANDGTLLSKFREKGMNILGIDPNRGTGKLARKQDITIFQSFWNKETAKAMKMLNISPDVITATSVFYHIEDLHSFVQGLDTLMGKDTIFCTQCVYMKEVIENKQFDHFYHEHTMIHAITPLKSLFKKYNLRLLDVDFYSIHGGSFVLYVGREESSFPTSTKIEDIITKEEQIGLNQIETYYNFTKEVEYNKQNLITLLKELKSSGKRVFGLGAPLKGSTLLNYYAIKPDLIECITEINEHKIGRYTPGTHIPIISETDIIEQPDYYLLLSWNFLDFFTEKYHEYLANGGKFIVPHPDVKIIDN